MDRAGVGRAGMGREGQGVGSLAAGIGLTRLASPRHVARDGQAIRVQSRISTRNLSDLVKQLVSRLHCANKQRAINPDRRGNGEGGRGEGEWRREKGEGEGGRWKGERKLAPAPSPRRFLAGLRSAGI